MDGWMDDSMSGIHTGLFWKAMDVVPFRFLLPTIDNVHVGVETCSNTENHSEEQSHDAAAAVMPSSHPDNLKSKDSFHYNTPTERTFACSGRGRPLCFLACREEKVSSRDERPQRGRNVQLVSLDTGMDTGLDTGLDTSQSTLSSVTK
ncbi:hypothetical protein JOB18_035007 [Solea senegalensis]|uniref:Uncharacterized protein n=1 Tax=Solea senegalensis TaxID=28829 RepID=A0AAV6QR07_SOLSE|nr:hypothetical protein JOB18_035007 [Solea senegalensis]